MADPKILGYIPARMGSNRFYGKPLFPILGIPMLGHVIERARMYKGWDRLFLTTCDKEIEEYGVSLNIPVIMTNENNIALNCSIYIYYLYIISKKKK